MLCLQSVAMQNNMPFCCMSVCETLFLSVQFRKDALYESVCQKLSPGVVEMDIIFHVFLTVVFVNGTVEIIDEGYAAVAGDVQFLLQIVAQRAVAKIHSVTVLEIPLLVDGIAEGV